MSVNVRYTSNVHFCIKINAYYPSHNNHIICFIISMVTFSAVDRSWVRSTVGQTKDYIIGICCFSAKHTSLKERAKKCWLVIRIMCASVATCHSLLFQWARTILIQVSMMVYYKASIIVISWNVICSQLEIAKKKYSLALNSNHYLTPRSK
jgi:hypothetical protein